MFYLLFLKLKKCDFKEHRQQEELGENTSAVQLIYSLFENTKIIQLVNFWDTINVFEFTSCKLRQQFLHISPTNCLVLARS